MFFVETEARAIHKLKQRRKAMSDNGFSTEASGLSVATTTGLSELSEEPRKRRGKKADKQPTKRRLILNKSDGSYRELSDDEEVVEIVVSNHIDVNNEQ
jgi:hypothetical protein